MGLRNFSMHPAHIPTIKQRVLTSEVGSLKPIIERMRRTDDPVKLSGLLEKLNAV
jgi:phosphotransferase system enzyme I (PtsI)